MGISFHGHQLVRLQSVAVVAGSLIYSAAAEIPCGYEVTAVILGPWCNDNLGFAPTRGKGLNEAGDVIGFYTRCSIGPDEAFVWRPGLGLFTLNRPAGFDRARAAAVDAPAPFPSRLNTRVGAS